MKSVLSWLVFFVTLVPCLLYGQNNAATWHTMSSDHFNLSYSTPYQEWAQSALAELEQIRALVKKEQGRVINEKIDVVVFDPYNQASGSAMPLSFNPGMRLHTTAPQSDSLIGHNSSWQQLLLLHEYIHLIHLAQHQRAPIRNTINRWWDIADALSINGQRWVSEGYATLLESRMTGRGRLFSDKAEVTLEQFVRAGRMPTYDQLNGSKGYLMDSMAYLVGSRFLYWLENKYGKDQIDAVWSRWNAKQSRDFEAAFQGVFQRSARSLYRQFVARYTQKVLNKLDQIPGDSALVKWQNISGRVRSPQLRDDGQYLVVSVTNDKDQSELVVYATADNQAAREKFEQANEQLLLDDPLDIPDTLPELFAHKVAYRLPQVNRRGVNNPRWLGDKLQIVFGAKSRDGRGDFHQDLFVWELKSGAVRQLTNNANLRRFDLGVNGDVIYAEQNRYGKSAIIKLELASGKITPITTASVNVIYDLPVFNPVTNQLVYLAHHGFSQWQIVIKDLNDNSDSLVPLPGGYQFVSYPQWSENGESLYYVASVDGQMKIYRYRLATDTLTALTNGGGHPSWPIEYHGNLLLLQQDSDGSDLYQLDLAKTNVHQVVNQRAGIRQAIDYQVNQQDALSQQEQIVLPQRVADLATDMAQPKPYGIGARHGTLTVNASYRQASNALLEVGYKSGDLLHHFDWQISGAASHNNSQHGVAGYVRWQQWPLNITLHGFDYRLSPTRQSDGISRQGDHSDGTTIESQGAWLDLSYPLWFDHSKLAFSAGYVAKKQRNSDNYGYLGLGWDWQHLTANWQFQHQARLNYLSGDLANDHWQGQDLSFAVLAGYRSWKVELGARHSERNNIDRRLLNLGGGQSTLMAPLAHQNLIFDPALPFRTLTGNSYVNYFAKLPLGDVFKLHYRRHKFSQQPTLAIAGIEAEMPVNIGFVGGNDLMIEAGVGHIFNKYKNDQFRLWAGLWYRW